MYARRALALISIPNLQLLVIGRLVIVTCRGLLRQLRHTFALVGTRYSILLKRKIAD